MAHIAPELIFQSGFEGTSRVEPLSQSDAALLSPGFEVEHIVGRDDTLPVKNDWQADIDNNPSAGRFFIEYTGGDASQRFARIVPEPGRPDNKVLHFWLGDAWSASEGQRKARIQTSLYGIREGYKDFHYTVRMYLHPDFRELEEYPGAISWLTIAEYWNNEWWVAGEKYGFRVTLGIGKPTAGKSALRFMVNAEDAGQKELWHDRNAEVEVPLGRWFTLDCYYKEGDQATGRYAMAITPEGGKRQVVFDVRGYTHNSHDPAPNGVTGFNPMKLYTSKDLMAFMKSRNRALQIYWDDFKLWKGVPADLTQYTLSAKRQ